MTTETILTEEQIAEIWNVSNKPFGDDFKQSHYFFAWNIVAAMLDSPEIQALRKDADRMETALKKIAAMDSMSYHSLESAKITAKAALGSDSMKNKLFGDLKTDDEKSNFFLSGGAYETGIIASSMQNDVAMAFHRCAEYEKEIQVLRRDAELFQFLLGEAWFQRAFDRFDPNDNGDQSKFESECRRILSAAMEQQK